MMHPPVSIQPSHPERTKAGFLNPAVRITDHTGINATPRHSGPNEDQNSHADRLPGSENTGMPVYHKSTDSLQRGMNCLGHEHENESQYNSEASKPKWPLQKHGNK